jgi:hypothetical protein
LLKRIAALERDVVDVKEQLEVGTAKLEQASEIANTTEKEKNELIKKIMSIEEQIDKTEEKLQQTQQAFKEASHLADENERFVSGFFFFYFRF